MINKQRVRRIKSLIYAFIILVLFLPLILMSILSFRMIGLAQKMSDKLDELKATVTQQAAPAAPSDSGYVIEPEGQSIKNQSIAPNQMEEQNPGNIAGQTPPASGLLSEVSGTSPSVPTSNENNADLTSGSNNGTFPQIGDTGNTSDTNSSTSDILNSSSSQAVNGNTAGAGGEDSGNNPQTGSSSVVLEGRNGNPATGR